MGAEGLPPQNTRCRTSLLLHGMAGLWKGSLPQGGPAGQCGVGLPDGVTVGLPAAPQAVSGGELARMLGMES